jgi:hypothetical protein
VPSGATSQALLEARVGKEKEKYHIKGKVKKNKKRSCPVAPRGLEVRFASTTSTFLVVSVETPVL